MTQFKVSENLKTKQFWIAVTAELFGTAVLIYLGISSVVLGTKPAMLDYSADIVRVAFTFAFAIACLVWTLGPISGCHLNPAVSFAFAAIGKISLVRAIFYTIAQCVGSTIGAALVYAVTPPEKRGGLGTTAPANGTTELQAFVVEAFITFVLLLVVCACVDEGRTNYKKAQTEVPLTVALCIIIVNLMGMPLSASSINPARSFGPALVIGIWDSHWVYWVGPISGAILGALMYHFLFSSSALAGDCAGPKTPPNSPTLRRPVDAIAEDDAAMVPKVQKK